MYLFVSQCISLYLNISLFGEHTGKEFVYPTQKLGRDTPREWCGCPGWARMQYGGDVNHLYRRVLPGLGLSLANYLVSFFTPDWSLDPPRDFAKMDPTAEAYRCMSILIMGWSSLPFLTLRSLLCMCGRESFPWPQEWAPYLFVLAELHFYH